MTTENEQLWIECAKRRDLARLDDGAAVVVLGYRRSRGHVHVEFKSGKTISVPIRRITEVWPRSTEGGSE